MAVQARARVTGIATRECRDWAQPALVFASVFTLLILAGHRLLGDPDTHWHVAVGAKIWRDGAVPWTDTFSHTFAGAPWIAKEWLSQLILFGAKRIGGWAGLVVLTAGTIALTLALLYDWLAERCKGLLALALMLLAAVLLAPHYLARPHVFAFLPLLVWTRGLVDCLDRERAPGFGLLAVLVVWANLHGSFTIAYPIAGLLGLEAVLRASAEQRAETIMRWGAFGALSLAAGCVTPYGIHALLITFTLFGSGESLPFIIEWQPLGWTLAGIIACGSALTLGAGLAAGGWRNAARLTLLAVLTLMMIRYARFLDVYALVAPFLVAAPLVRRFPDLAPERQPSRTAWSLFVRIALAFIGAVALVAVAVLSPQPDPAVTPRAALAAARQAGVKGPVYNSYGFGGFLIAEGVPTFIDGRTDQLFLGGFISTLYRLTTDKDSAAFLDFLNRRDVTWAIVASTGDEPRHFEGSPVWKRIHRDDVASVYVKETRGSLD